MVQSFTAQLQKFSDDTFRRSEAVIKQSIQDVFSLAQTPISEGGRLPVDLSMHRNSLVTGLLDKLPPAEGPESYELAVASFELGDILQGGWTMEYSRRLELGFEGEDSKGRYYDQEGFYFMREAAAQWQNFININAATIS